MTTGPTFQVEQATFHRGEEGKSYSSSSSSTSTAWTAATVSDYRHPSAAAAGVCVCVFDDLAATVLILLDQAHLLDIPHRDDVEALVDLGIVEP
eukprot:CAMPEP_0195007032 /NCGR_PEP_ID=MMETSP0326_2-20130528/7271_1 /TAXON_ID=2866 ORGANISM="Crypthecodinium cohnii, Strain Seligo" /NCGR_SAMPLE_ID=MMETSP0326_2 /ASSEMBLY_ACC=CAM_ASM_000348 /LENGTH=93 /DNA_ID=CAMNT_0040014179 /DNA_START=103 /DNA_END=381 /DNA_ORIENTATION=-